MLPEDDLRDVLQHVPKIRLDLEGAADLAIGLDVLVVVINLAHRADRWETLYKRMSTVGLNRPIRVRAIEGARLSGAHIAALLQAPATSIDEAPRSHLTLTRPAVGCFLSHLAIWRWVIDHNVPRVLILEDDAVPAPHFDAARFRAVLASIPEDAGMVFLGRVIMHGMADRADSANLARIYYFNCTFAYTITPAACRALIPHLLPMRRHIDHQISQVLIEQRHAFAAYYTEPAFFETDWSLRSDCYVPIAAEPDADRELAQILETYRGLLLGEERPLLP